MKYFPQGFHQSNHSHQDEDFSSERKNSRKLSLFRSNENFSPKNLIFVKVNLNQSEGFSSNSPFFIKVMHFHQSAQFL